uniref:Uncharacterized protein n=1 Tax=Manihot esculenta TaxID=3983 RepID=A0A2C9UTR0_MANES
MQVFPINILKILSPLHGKPTDRINFFMVYNRKQRQLIKFPKKQVSSGI